MSMYGLINWANNNNGFIMVVLTAIYVIATIIICVFNYKTIKVTERQIDQSNRIQIENSRGIVIPKLEVIYGKMICLSFENIGNSYASNIKIEICDKWLEALSSTATMPRTAEKLRKLSENELYLGNKQRVLYGLCIPGNGRNDFDKISKEKLEINITYLTLNKQYEEKFIIDFKASDTLIERNEYFILENIDKELSNINKKLKDIDRTLDNIGEKAIPDNHKQ